MIVEVVVAPDTQEESCCTDEHSLHDTNVRDEVQDVVNIPLDEGFVEVHSNSNGNLFIFVQIPRESRLRIEPEDGRVLKLGQLFQIE